MAQIHSLVYKPVETQPPHHYTRVPVNSANLIVGHGIEGDAKGGKHPDRQLNIMSYESLAQLESEGFSVQPGEMGEQIVVRDLDVSALSPGTRLQFGDTALVEIVKLRTGCDRFEAIQGKPRTDAAGRLGVLARVVADGAVRVGDPVRVLETVVQ